MNTEIKFSPQLPDTQLIKKELELIYNTVKTLQLDFLSTMQEKMKPLKSVTSQVNSAFNDNLSEILVKLGNTELSSLDTDIAELEKPQSDLSEEQKQHVLQSLYKHRKNLIDTLRKTIEQSTRSMASPVDDLKQISLQLPNDDLQNQLQNHLDAAIGANTGLLQKKKSLDEDLATLNETISIYEKENMAARFQKFLPTTAELNALTLTAPKIAALQLGLNRLSALLGVVSDSLTYQDLVDKRDALKQSTQDVINQSRGAQEEARQNQMRLDTLTELARLHDAKNTLAQEVQKVCDSLFSFIDVYLTPTEAPLLTQQAITELKEYIESFHSVWRKP